MVRTRAYETETSKIQVRWYVSIYRKKKEKRETKKGASCGPFIISAVFDLGLQGINQSLTPVPRSPVQTWGADGTRMDEPDHSVRLSASNLSQSGIKFSWGVGKRAKRLAVSQLLGDSQRNQGLRWLRS